jgi:hypothetical protein
MADYSDLPFVAGSITYPVDLVTLATRTASIATEIENSRGAFGTLVERVAPIDAEIIAAREGEVSILANLDNNYLDTAGTGSGLDANGQVLTNSTTGTSYGHGVTVSQAAAINALGTGGIDRGDIAVTSLGIGAIGANNIIKMVGTSISGEAKDLSLLNLGTLTAHQAIGANSGASALEAKDLTNIATGTLTNGSRVAVSIAGGLEDYDGTQEEISASLYSGIVL